MRSMKQHSPQHTYLLIALLVGLLLVAVTPHHHHPGMQSLGFVRECIQDSPASDTGHDTTAEGTTVCVAGDMLFVSNGDVQPDLLPTPVSHLCIIALALTALISPLLLWEPIERTERPFIFYQTHYICVEGLRAPPVSSLFSAKDVRTSEWGCYATGL